MYRRHYDSTDDLSNREKCAYLPMIVSNAVYLVRPPRPYDTEVVTRVTVLEARSGAH